jgi:hypothetical protein
MLTHDQRLTPEKGSTVVKAKQRHSVSGDANAAGSRSLISSPPSLAATGTKRLGEMRQGPHQSQSATATFVSPRPTSVQSWSWSGRIDPLEETI